MVVAIVEAGTSVQKAEKANGINIALGSKKSRVPAQRWSQMRQAQREQRTG